MSETLHSSQSPEKIKPEQMRLIIQDVINGTFELFNVDTMANYDADFSGDEPLFIKIEAKQKGQSFGYLVFHDFLRRVGRDNTFVTTDLTNDGKRLFEKTVSDGLLEKVSEPFGLHRLTKWKIIGDPIKNLEKIRDEKI